MRLLIVLALLSGALAACRYKGRTYQVKETWIVKLRDAKSGQRESFVHECGRNRRPLVTGCFDARRDVTIPLRASRTFPRSRDEVLVLKCGSQRYNSGFFLERTREPRLGCRDAQGQRRRHGDQWISTARNIVVECRVDGDESFRILDVACHHPVAGRLAPAQTVRFDQTEVRCLRYRGRSRDTLRLTEQSIKPRRPLKRLDEPLPSLFEILGAQSLDSVRKEIEDTDACLEENGEFHKAGAVWASKDGSLRMRCVKTNGEVTVEVHSCLTPQGKEIPKGAARVEGDFMYGCRRQNGGLVYRDSLRTESGLLGRLCRKPDAEAVAAVKKENAAIVKENQALLRRITTAAQRAEFDRAVVAKDPFLYQSTAYYKALAQLKPTKPLPAPNCDYKVCDGGICWAGPGIVRIFERKCARKPCYTDF